MERADREDKAGKTRGKGSRSFLMGVGLLLFACAGLGVVMNATIGPATGGMMGTAQAPSLGLNFKTPEPLIGGTVIPTLTPATSEADLKKYPPPQACGRGDRYAVLCKDGSLRRGFGISGYSCSESGGVDRYLTCP
jgi:hypothetical protein